jgi:NEDD8-activating enzyme E1 regulatory subunit
MKAQSSVYVKLQNIYKTKAREDAAEVWKTVQALKGGRNIDPEEVAVFCKNAAFVKLINAHGDSPESERLSSVAGKLPVTVGFTRDSVRDANRKWTRPIN